MVSFATLQQQMQQLCVIKVLQQSLQPVWSYTKPNAFNLLIIHRALLGLTHVAVGKLNCFALVLREFAFPLNVCF